jgi:hypothetical protein
LGEPLEDPYLLREPSALSLCLKIHLSVTTLASGGRGIRSHVIIGQRGLVLLFCRYPADRVPPCTSFKTRQVTGRAPTRCHVPYSSEPHFPVKVGSDAVTCPMASDLISQLRWAPALSRVLWLRTLPPNQGGSRCCHAFRGP